jgi:peptidoglycan hydrolase-like protein with peptidoglycan-binding domain
VSPKACPVYPYKIVLGLDENGSMRFATSSNPAGATAQVVVSATETALPTLRVTAKGAAVRALQMQLNAKGHNVDVDGIFGQQTLAAVKAFQKAEGLGVDGIVGPITWGALEA